MTRRKIIEKLMDTIHGSGFDDEPQITENKTGIVVKCGYHYMNDGGYYAAVSEK